MRIVMNNSRWIWQPERSQEAKYQETTEPGSRSNEAKKRKSQENNKLKINEEKNHWSHGPGNNEAKIKTNKKTKKAMNQEDTQPYYRIFIKSARKSGRFYQKKNWRLSDVGVKKRAVSHFNGCTIKTKCATKRK